MHTVSVGAPHVLIPFSLVSVGADQRPQTQSGIRECQSIYRLTFPVLIHIIHHYTPIIISFVAFIPIPDGDMYNTITILTINNKTHSPSKHIQLCINLTSLELKTLLPNYFFRPSCWVAAYCSLINPIFTAASLSISSAPCK